MSSPQKRRLSPPSVSADSIFQSPSSKPLSSTQFPSTFTAHDSRSVTSNNDMADNNNSNDTTNRATNSTSNNTNNNSNDGNNIRTNHNHSPPSAAQKLFTSLIRQTPEELELARLTKANTMANSRLGKGSFSPSKSEMRTQTSIHSVHPAGSSSASLSGFSMDEKPSSQSTMMVPSLLLLDIPSSPLYMADNELEDGNDSDSSSAPSVSSPPASPSPSPQFSSLEFNQRRKKRRLDCNFEHAREASLQVVDKPSFDPGCMDESASDSTLCHQNIIRHQVDHPNPRSGSQSPMSTSKKTVQFDLGRNVVFRHITSSSIIMSSSTGTVESDGSDQDCKDESTGLSPHIGRRQSSSSPWWSWPPTPAASDTLKRSILDDAEAAAAGNNEYRSDKADSMAFQLFATKTDGITPQLTRNSSMPLSNAGNPFDVTMDEAKGVSQQESSTVQGIRRSTNDSDAQNVVMCEPQLEKLSQQVDQVQLISPLRRNNGTRGSIRNRQGMGSLHHPYRRSETTRPAGSGSPSALAIPPRLARAASFSVHSQRTPAMLRREASTTALMDIL